MKTAVVILGHGSRSKDADGAILKVVAAVKETGAFEIVEHAFLQYSPFTPQQTLERCIRQKADRIVIVPFFMQSGAHVSRDIPHLLHQIKEKHPGVDISVTDYVGSHPLMAEIVADFAGKIL